MSRPTNRLAGFVRDHSGDGAFGRKAKEKIGGIEVRAHDDRARKRIVLVEGFEQVTPSLRRERVFPRRQVGEREAAVLVGDHSGEVIALRDRRDRHPCPRNRLAGVGIDENAADLEISARGRSALGLR